MKWLKQALKYEDRYEVRHKGRLQFAGSKEECQKWLYEKIHKEHSYSVKNALEFEGWSIKPSHATKEPLEVMDIPSPKREGESWVFDCPECGFGDIWTSRDLAERGTPVCPHCDEDMKIRESGTVQFDCPKCGFVGYWPEKDLFNKPNPICPHCDTDMLFSGQVP